LGEPHKENGMTVTVSKDGIDGYEDRDDRPPHYNLTIKGMLERVQVLLNQHAQVCEFTLGYIPSTIFVMGEIKMALIINPKSNEFMNQGVIQLTNIKSAITLIEYFINLMEQSCDN
jgi:hypothetical protein